MKKLISWVLVLVLLTVCVSASACTAFYVGSSLTDDGSMYFARAEDLTNSFNKLMFVIESGVHKAGELYSGCYGFSYTFTHDSYGYTAFQDDNLSGVDNECPDCGSTHAHTPYQAAGTNEKGVSMSATESLYPCDAATEADPFTDTGIEEAEIVTVILSEAATAKEGVELLCKIYDEAGANAGSGIFIADSNEIWYIENGSGHQYIALKLNDTLAFGEPNQSVIGLIDLNDENVIASPDIIGTAKKAGTYKGDESVKTIDFAASYFADQGQSERMTSILNYLCGVDTFTNEEGSYDTSAYVISNLDDNGAVVPFYNAIVLPDAFTLSDALNYYKLPSIGSTRNLETHIFQYIPGCENVIEWVAMNDASCNAFVPYNAQLTTDVIDSLKVSTAPAEFSVEKPEDGLYYAATVKTWNEAGERVSMEGYKILPDNWADSYYWSLDALTNLVAYGNLSEEQTAGIKAEMAVLQEEIVSGYAAALTSDAVTAEAATAYSAACAQKVYELAVKLTKEIISK